MRTTILTAQYSVWCTSGILTPAEIEALYEAGIDLTLFNYEVDINNEAEVEGALDTIREHHPGLDIWVDSKLECKI